MTRIVSTFLAFQPIRSTDLKRDPSRDLFKQKQTERMNFCSKNDLRKIEVPNRETSWQNSKRTLLRDLDSKSWEWSNVGLYQGWLVITKRKARLLLASSEADIKMWTRRPKKTFGPKRDDDSHAAQNGGCGVGAHGPDTGVGSVPIAGSVSACGCLSPK